MSPGYMESPYDPTDKSWYKPDGHARTIRTNAPGTAAPSAYNYEDYLPVLKYEYKAPTTPAPQSRSATRVANAAAARARLTNTYTRQPLSESERAERALAASKERARAENELKAAFTRNFEITRLTPAPTPKSGPRKARAHKVVRDVSNQPKEGESWYRPRADKPKGSPKRLSVSAKNASSGRTVSQKQSGLVKTWYSSMRKRIFKD